MSETGARVRLRTAQERRKALKHLSELRATGRLARSLVIAEMTDGETWVLAQEMRAHEIPRLLLMAAKVLEAADEARTRLVREPLEFSVALGGESSPGERIRPKVTTNAAGILVPPEGENFISCPECSHGRYYVLVPNDETDPRPVARLSCAHCGNEVAWATREPGP